MSPAHELHLKIFRHPVYLAHKLDGQDLRICPVDGDIYVGPASEKQGISLENGGSVLVNPNRERFDCRDYKTAPLPLSSTTLEQRPALLAQALETLDFAHAHPEMVLTNENAQEAFGKWIAFLQDREIVGKDQH